MLAIRVTIRTGYTRVSVPRIPVYIRYIWTLSPNILPFRSRIYAFFNWSSICVNSSAGMCKINGQIHAPCKDPYTRLLRCPNMWVQQIMLYMSAWKMSFNKMARVWLQRKLPQLKIVNMAAVLRQWWNILPWSMRCLINVCCCSPTTEFLETVCLFLNNCSWYHSHPHCDIAENFIVLRLKVPMTWKIFSAYLKDLSKYPATLKIYPWSEWIRRYAVNKN